MLFLSLVLSVVSLGSAMANDADMSRNRGPKRVVINVTVPPKGVCADHDFHCCPPPVHHKPHHKLHHDCCDFGHNHHNKPGKPHGHFDHAKPGKNHGKNHGKPGKNHGRDDFKPNGRPGGAYGNGAPGRR